MHAKLIAACALAAAASANAVVVSGTQILLSQGSTGISNYAITAIQEPDRMDTTTMWFNATTNGQSTVLQPVSWNVDQEADYYLVQQGAAFTKESIASGQFKPLFTLDHPYSLEVPKDAIFYLGVTTTQTRWPGDGTSTGGGFRRNVFGWASIQNGPDGLKLLDSAMTYNGEGGIIIGTTTAVPESTTWALMLLGLSGLAAATGKQRKAAPKT